MQRLLLPLLMMLAALAAGAQTSDAVTLHLKDAPVSRVLETLERDYNYVFVYSSGTIDTARKVSVDVTAAPIADVLGKVFAGTGVEWVIKNRQVALRRGQTPERKGRPAKGATHTLKGVVTEAATGEPLIGASVRVKGHKEGVVTDIDGNYSIEVGSNQEVEYSYVGFATQTLAVGDLGVLDVAMKTDNKMLSEVVVVGAGTQARVSVTGSIQSVQGTELRAPTSSLTSNFAGKLAGVISSTTSGEPGAVSEFYIRGVGTFGGRATPLILLDDVEISSADLNRLPAESIESFSILKDASATAIYGARGANGVMIITTKKGSENTRARINASVECSFLKPVNRVTYVDGPTYMEMYNEALLSRTPGATPKYSQQTIDYTRSGINPYVYPNVDWYDLLFRSHTMNQRANVNMSGGGSKGTYYMALQVNHDSGMLKVPDVNSLKSNIEDWNYIFQNNISYKPTPTTTIDLHLNAQFGNRKGPGMSMTDIFYSTYNSNPVTFPAYYPSEDGEGHIRFGNAYRSDSRLYDNPYAQMLRTFSESNYATINASLRGTQKLDFLTEGLSATVLVNMKSYATSDYTNTIEPYFYQAVDNTWDPSDPDFFMLRPLQKGTDFIAQGGINRYSDFLFYLDARVNYARQFGAHNVSGMLMYMQREYRNNVLPQRNQGLSGRFTYDYDRKYLVEVNFGYNGTERLAKGRRFELFPAVSLGWRVSSEKFWEPITPVISEFKIRGSYGLVGSDETGLLAGAAHFLYKNEVLLGSGGGFHTGAELDQAIYKRGPAFLKYAVANAGWERAKKFDIGFDMQLLNSVTIAFDYFNDHRDRILQRRSSWPGILGYGNAVPWGNVGKVDNHGVELSVNWRKNILPDLSVDVRGNFTYTENKYVYNDEPDYPFVWQTLTGKPLSATYGYVADGLFKDEADIRNHASQANLGSEIMPGDIKYRDINGDGIITEDDRVMLSPYGSTPRIQYGFGVNVVWRKWDFGVFFNGSAKRALMINNIAPFCSGDGNPDRNVMSFIAADYWSPSNPDAAYPRLGVTERQIKNNTEASSFWLRDGSFLRFKTLELGYTFPFVRVYVSGDNLAVWSKFKEWDPELWYNNYPLQRTFNVGAQFNF